MPSHLRMEEASSIIASKSINDGLGRSDIDDLDDFVLQIDENEINNEIKGNELLEDVSNDVLKSMESNEENIFKSLKTHNETKEPTKCGTEDGSDKKSCDFQNKNQSIVSANINGLRDKQLFEMETESESQNSSETGLKIYACANADMETKTGTQNNSEIELRIEASVSTASNKTDTGKDALNKKTLEAINDGENVGIEGGKNKTLPIEKSDVTEENQGLNLNVSVIAGNGEMREETNEFMTENLDSVDKELDSLLSMEPEIANEQSDNISEPMEVDLPPNELPVMKMTTIEHSPSILLELQNQDDKIDSDFDVSNQNTAPDSPTITMHSPQTLNDLDENSCSNDGFLKEKIVKGFSNINKAEGETTENVREEFIYHKVKHIQISAQSNVLKENNNSEKRLKREADEGTISNDQKKIKLDKVTTNELTVENNLEDKNESNLIETLKKEKESDSSSESNDDSGSSTGNESSDESVDRNGTEALKEVLKINNQIKNNELSPEALREIKEGREKLFASYFEGKTDITLNRCVLEEMVLTQIIEMISYKTDVGQLRQKCRILQNEQIKLNQMVNALKKQAECARIIIKRLIDEKKNNKSWTQSAIPLKVTRSVGLQVCTCGSMTVRSKVPDKECKPAKPENAVTGDSSVSCKNDIGSNVNKVGPLDNKENISSNIEKDIASNKDNSNTDDVVIVSVTESNSSSSPPSIDKKILEVPKNGIVHTEKLVRKPLVVEYPNCPTTPNKTSVVSNQNKIATDNLLVEKESTKTIKNDVSEIIDLTDKEDNPVKKSEASSKLVPASNSSGIYKIVSPQPGSLAAVNGIKKTSLPSSAAVNKKSVDIAPAADLVNSYDHLPKYPASPKYPPNVVKPPRPILRIGKNTSGKQGIMLSWSFEGGRNPPNIEEYQLYAYQESKNSEKVKTDTWKKVGDIKALPLPMACFLTQFVEGHKYHFIVRAVDTQKKLGDFSLPGSIILHAAGQTPSAS